MKKLGLVLLGALLGCGQTQTELAATGDDAPGGPDAGPVCETGGCSVLAQAGCGTGDKCTWTLVGASAGAINCAPQGTVAVGGACTITGIDPGTSCGATAGYDDCVAGAMCVGGLCEQICDNQGGLPTCPADELCVTHAGLFANVGATFTPAGVCEVTVCDPIADNDFDGAGSAHTKTGTACGTDPLIGCYGRLSNDPAHPTKFTCAAPYPGTEHLVSGSPVPVSEFAVNSCAPGYWAEMYYGADGSVTASCFAYCQPGDSYLGAPTQQPNGVAGHGCNPTDEEGTFGAKPDGSATSNGAHCMYSWAFEITPDGQRVMSPTSNSVGICIDHTQYKYDSDGDGVADAVWPPCASLPLHGTDTAIGADQFGCVSSTLAGPSARHRVMLTNLPTSLGR